MREGWRSRTWVLIAEPGRARLLSPQTDEGSLEEIDVFERITPASGIAFDADDSFVSILIDHLVQSYDRGEFTRLLLISRDLDFLDTLLAALPADLQAGVDLLVEADVIDMEADVVRAILPASPSAAQPGA
jgi:hypothetical protein